MKHKKTEKRPAFRFTTQDRKRMKSYIYQLSRVIVLGFKFWRLVK